MERGILRLPTAYAAGREPIRTEDPMALARPRRTAALGALPARPADVVPTRPWLPVAAALPDRAGPIRRCTFRRLDPVGAGVGDAAYAVSCLYPSMEEPIPLGDLGSARAWCGACSATGIFRPDED